MPEELSPEEKDHRTSNNIEEGKVDEFALKKQQETPSSGYVWLWILVGGIVLVALAGGVILGFLGGRLTRPSDGYEELLGAAITHSGGNILLDPVHRNGPAESVGLQTGDVLVSIDGEKITRASQAQTIIGKHKTGDEVLLVIRRTPRPPEEYHVILGVTSIIPVPATPVPVQTTRPPVIYQQGNLGEARLGIKYRMILPDDSYAVENGALIISVLDDYGPAVKAGLNIGDIIISVGKYDLTEDFTLEDALALFEPGERVKMTVLKNDEIVTLRVTLGSD